MADNSKNRIEADIISPTRLNAIRRAALATKIETETVRFLATFNEAAATKFSEKDDPEKTITMLYHRNGEVFKGIVGKVRPLLKKEGYTVTTNFDGIFHSMTISWD